MIKKSIQFVRPRVFFYTRSEIATTNTRYR
jgi:hypothetical protein